MLEIERSSLTDCLCLQGDTAVLLGPDGEELDRLTTEIEMVQRSEAPEDDGQSSSVDAFLFLTDLDLVEDRVTIRNGGADTVALEGWQLRSARGGQHYDFAGRGTVLAGGTQITIWSGKEAKERSREEQLADRANDHVFWRATPVWADKGDTAW